MDETFIVSDGEEENVRNMSPEESSAVESGKDKSEDTEDA